MDTYSGDTIPDYQIDMRWIVGWWLCSCLNTTTKKQEKNIMTQRNIKTFEYTRPIRPMIQFVPMSDVFPDNKVNIMIQRNNFDVRQIRSMIQFVPEQDDTTEAKLEDVREQMTFTRAKKTIRRTGWYFTEPYSPCGEYITTEEIKESIAKVFGA